MTVQVPDKLRYNGAELLIRGFPLPDSKLKETPLRPNGSLNSGCWRGYVGQWEIKDGSLYLTSMDLQGFEKMAFKDIFKEATDKGLKADWYDGKLICDAGEVIRYEPYSVIFARTVMFDIESGDVVSEETIINE